MYQADYCAHDCCSYVSESELAVRHIVDLAIEQPRKLVAVDDVDLLESALAVLDFCRVDRCPCHGDESEARELLEGHIDNLRCDAVFAAEAAQ